MEYYVVDKCYNVEDTQSLVINCGNNKENGTKLKPYDDSRTEGSYQADYTLCEFNSEISCREYDGDEQRKYFDSLYISDFKVFYNVETIPNIDTLDTKNLTFLSKIKRRNCYKFRPTIMITYRISTGHIYCEQKCDRIILGEEKVISIKPDNFENSIDLCLTANTEKNVYNGTKTRFKCDIHTRLLKSSIITYNGDKYNFDPIKICNSYCVCTTPMSKKRESFGEYTWEIYCIGSLYYANKPTVTKVTEEIFKKTSKCNADIVIYKNKTYLIKNTSNSNVIIDYSNLPEDKKKRYECNYSKPDCAVWYTPSCSNCKNCYNCYKCDNCENCELCDNCTGCISCNDCNNCEYYDHMQCADINMFNLEEDDKKNKKSKKIEDIDIYTKYVKKYVD